MTLAVLENCSSDGDGRHRDRIELFASSRHWGWLDFHARELADQVARA